MEVILLETFDRLGQIGDVVRVKNGFARNFLIPNKKALRANKENKEKFLKIKNDLIEKNKKVIEESKVIIKQIENKEIIFIRNASDNGQLYGSVSPKDISNYFNEKKIPVKPSNINLHTSIKKIGIYDINIKLHADVGCSLKINVATSEQNAKKQKEDLEIEKNKNVESAKQKLDTKEQKDLSTDMSSNKPNKDTKVSTKKNVAESTDDIKKENSKDIKVESDKDLNKLSSKKNEEVKSEKDQKKTIPKK